MVRTLLKRVLQITLIGILGIFGVYLSAYPLGILTGTVSTWSGDPTLQGAGLPSRWSRYYREFLQERYGLSVRERGCTVGGIEGIYIAGYNRVICDSICERFGEDAFEVAEAHARAEYEVAQQDPWRNLQERRR